MVYYRFDDSVVNIAVHFCLRVRLRVLVHTFEFRTHLNTPEPTSIFVCTKQLIEASA